MMSCAKPVLECFWIEKLGSDFFNERHWFFFQNELYCLFILKAFLSKFIIFQRWWRPTKVTSNQSNTYKRFHKCVLERFTYFCFFLLLSRCKHFSKRSSFVLLWLQKLNDKGNLCYCVAEIAETSLKEGGTKFFDNFPPLIIYKIWNKRAGSIST